MPTQIAPTHTVPTRLPTNRQTGTLPDGTRELNNDHQSSPTPGQIMSTRSQITKRKKANITIATLNMRGSSTPTLHMTSLEKWTRINYMIRKNKIAILALQETHLNAEMVESIKRCFGKNFELLYSSDRENLH